MLCTNSVMNLSPRDLVSTMPGTIHWYEKWNTDISNLPMPMVLTDKDNYFPWIDRHWSYMYFNNFIPNVPMPGIVFQHIVWYVSSSSLQCSSELCLLFFLLILNIKSSILLVKSIYYCMFYIHWVFRYKQLTNFNDT